ncbi:hypothetical protein ABZ845_12260 [Streptomyces sp. NPDC047022]|uniref:hypothetical protein n=1 Tax=Streptomyces sp. NPDC047022 TaxID=3155737 RepID=UPI0033E7D0B7
MPDYASPAGELILAVHSFAVEIGGMRILVDTGIGNGKTRTDPAWNDLDTPCPDRLATAGFTPENGAGLVRSEPDGFRLVPQECSGKKPPRGVRKGPPTR